ncbi:MAG: DUF4340 domain-containing protein [Candidatus Omnitrophica bacterium]|nr:DUF4340 domain-containing protein [Candidatus Omnitrophota bacterium]
MKLSTFLILLGLFAVVSVSYFYLNPKPLELLESKSIQRDEEIRPAGLETPAVNLPRKDEIKPVSYDSMNLLNLSQADEINWFQIQNLEKHKTITMIKENGNWLIKYPVQCEADPKVLGKILEVLESTEKIKMLQPEKDWEEYGLLKPAIKIGIQTIRHPERRYLYLGNKSPIGGYTFARWQNGEEYFLLPEDFGLLFDYSVYNFREKRIFRLDMMQASRIRFQGPSESYEMFKQGFEWIWQKPNLIAGMRVPMEEMQRLLNGLEDLMVKEFLDTNGSAAEDTGISNSEAFVKVYYKEQTETLFIGNEAVVRDAFYIHREGDDADAFVARSQIRRLFDEISALASSTVVD